MPITKSAKKALRQSFRKNKRNLAYKNKIKDLQKQVLSLVSKNKQKDANKLLPEFYQALDKAAKKGIIKGNTASRKKSRITKSISKTTN